MGEVEKVEVDAGGKSRKRGYIEMYIYYMCMHLPLAVYTAITITISLYI